MPVSSNVNVGDTILATQQQALRSDILDSSLGHKHTGAASGGVLVVLRGTLAARPAAGAANKGFLYKCTDVGAENVWWSDGSAWQTFVPVDPAATVAGARTLGPLATQAAIGTHTHTPTEVQSGVAQGGSTGGGAPGTDSSTWRSIAASATVDVTLTLNNVAANNRIAGFVATRVDAWTDTDVNTLYGLFTLKILIGGVEVSSAGSLGLGSHIVKGTRVPGAGNINIVGRFINGPDQTWFKATSDNIIQVSAIELAGA